MKKPPVLRSYSALNSSWQTYLDRLDDSSKELFDKLDSIGQLNVINQIEFSSENGEMLVNDLKQIDLFFAAIGGIVGYQNLLKKIIHPAPFEKKILEAPYIAIDNLSQTNIEEIKSLIEEMPKLAEIYAIGGAADRLNLVSNKKMLPAACLKILGKTLLEHLIHDLEAKEWLYYKFTKQTLTIPIVMMTSFEKDNQAHIHQILETHNFFNRPKNSFLIFNQPQVPMVDESLNWQTQNSHALFLKPGGHGALWSLCQKEKIFDKLLDLGCEKISIRQINNPIACVDFGHLAFLGYGFLKKAQFGFFACQRFAGSLEGINVLLKDETGSCLTNIEYCQLSDVGIKDVPNSQGYSQFPANTNVLFGDIETLKQITKEHPLAGQILNFKSYPCQGGVKPMARLETMMQNVADYMVEEGNDLKKVFMTLSPRRKTISPIKKQKTPGSSYEETPESCFYDFMKNAEELLDLCQIEHHRLETIEEFYLAPSYIFTYLPALGPIFSLIASKLQRGCMEKGAYLELNIAECDISDFYLKGALKVTATNPYGFNSSSRTFSENNGRVQLTNCRFINRGVDLENSNSFCQDLFKFYEKCEIILEGFSEFHAKDIEFKGDFLFKVPDGYRLDVYLDHDNKMVNELTRLVQPSWTSSYSIYKDHFVVLKNDP